MFTLSAPHPAIQTVTYLSNPQFGDADNIDDTLNLMRAKNGTVYTYVKTKTRDKNIWQFKLTKPKFLELAAFYKAYAGVLIKVVDHLDRVWLGHITNNPFEGNMSGTGRPVVQDWGSADTVSCSMEFEGTLQ